MAASAESRRWIGIGHSAEADGRHAGMAAADAALRGAEPKLLVVFCSDSLGRRSGEDHVRFVGEADFEERSLVCIAEVPQGATAWFMEGDDDSVLEATDAACADALAPLEGHDALGVLAFDCIARRGVLGDERIKAEVERVAANAKDAPVAGFYTYGEIARTSGVKGFHNQTLVLLALA